MVDAVSEGPDFSLGVSLSCVPDEGTVAGRVGDEPVLLSRLDGALYAVGGACTHYHAPLSSGRVEGSRAICPLHHACFDLKTGAVLRAPALDPLDRWRVEIVGDTAFVRERRAADGAKPRAGFDGRVLIVGGGAAGLACANALRTLGHAGAITMLSADRDVPCDRPNLSKDYLAGSAPEAWMPLRAPGWFDASAIDLRLGTEVRRIDLERRIAHCAAGGDVPFDRLLLATGCEPRRLQAPGFDRENVFVLRSLADARAIAARAGAGARAVVIGSSFIGLEAAAALCRRGVRVEIVSVEEVPFDRVLGPVVGTFFRRLHEDRGVAFHLGRAPSSFDGQTVRLADGTAIAADFVLVGIGVEPRVELARSAGLAVENGVRVDRFLETACPGVYAAGDIAAYPDPVTGRRLRIEHWVTAQRQGEVAAANMLGLARPFEAVPFFWTEQYGVALRYVGHSSRWSEVRVDGDVAGDFTARYFQDGVLRASASVGRDRENLVEEQRLEAEVPGRAASASVETAPA